MSAWEELVGRCAPDGGWAVECYLGGPEPLMPGVTALGGVPSSGKSSLACHVAAKVASRGMRVFYLTLDDSWGNVVSRCMSAWSVDEELAGRGRSFSWSALPATRARLDVRPGDDLSRAAFELRGRDPALMAAARWEDGPAGCLAVVDSVTDVGEVESVLAGLFEEGEPPALVVVDYVQQFQTGDPELDKAEYSRVSQVVGRLQRASLWSGTPLLMLSSLRKLSRVEDEPDLTWFRGTSEVGYGAWAAVILTKGEREGSGWREVVLNVVKNKGGRSDIRVPMELWGAHSWTRGIADG